MMSFWAICILLILLALALVLPPLLRREDASDPRRVALEHAHRSGVLDAGEYTRKLAALGNTTPTSISPLARNTAIALVLILPLLAAGLYQKLGDARVFDPSVQSVANAMQSAQRAGLPPMEQAIAGLAERLAREPDDAQGWLLLGRAYKSTERFAEARAALARALALTPDAPDVLVETAEAQALSTPGARFDGEPLTLLQRALERDPNHQRGLWLLGIAQFQSGDTDTASATWEKLIATLPEDSPMRDSLRQRIDELKAQTGLAASADTPSVPALQVPPAPRLDIRVNLAAELAQRVAPDDVLFVFARAAEGSRAPLAIQRLRAADLPLSITLDDSHAMVPQMNLSSAARIVVGARISRSGNAQAQSGDLETLSEPLSNSHKAVITLTIDQILP